MHTQLAQAGIDGVKVDSQAITATLGEGRGGGAAFARAYITEMEKSVQENFGQNSCINCMSHRSECLYAYNSTSLVRVSDDFWPGDTASHTVCVHVCLCVSVCVCVNMCVFFMYVFSHICVCMFVCV
jgi:raffinose synthase